MPRNPGWHTVQYRRVRLEQRAEVLPRGKLPRVWQGHCLADRPDGIEGNEGQAAENRAVHGRGLGLHVRPAPERVPAAGSVEVWDDNTARHD